MFNNIFKKAKFVCVGLFSMLFVMFLMTDTVMASEIEIEKIINKNLNMFVSELSIVKNEDLTSIKPDVKKDIYRFRWSELIGEEKLKELEALSIKEIGEELSYIDIDYFYIQLEKATKTFLDVGDITEHFNYERMIEYMQGELLEKYL